MGGEWLRRLCGFVKSDFKSPLGPSSRMRLSSRPSVAIVFGTISDILGQQILLYIDIIHVVFIFVFSSLLYVFSDLLFQDGIVFLSIDNNGFVFYNALGSAIFDLGFL